MKSSLDKMLKRFGFWGTLLVVISLFMVAFNGGIAAYRFAVGPCVDAPTFTITRTQGPLAGMASPEYSSRVTTEQWTCGRAGWANGTLAVTYLHKCETDKECAEEYLLEVEQGKRYSIVVFANQTHRLGPFLLEKS